MTAVTMMTRAEALAEAQRRWGEMSYAIETEPAAWPEYRYDVGVIAEGMAFLGLRSGTPHSKGSGDSWEAAFADADRRAK